MKKNNQYITLMFEVRINYLPMQATIWQDKYATFLSARSLQCSALNELAWLGSSQARFSSAHLCKFELSLFQAELGLARAKPSKPVKSFYQKNHLHNLVILEEWIIAHSNRHIETSQMVTVF